MAAHRLNSLIGLTILWSTTCSQTSFGYVSNGVVYVDQCTSSGYVLKSEYPVARPYGVGAGTKLSEGKETIFLGKSCDATHILAEKSSDGKWCWANGGFFAEFNDSKTELNLSLAFPRQELWCEDGENVDYEFNCQC